MNFLLKNTLKVSQKIYAAMSRRESKFGRNWKMFANKEYANNLIYDRLISDEPCMIARFGSTEMLCLLNYLGVKGQNTKLLDYVKGNTLPWWWEPGMMTQMQKWSGFFPATEDKILAFCELMMNDMKEVDVLGSWLKEEAYFADVLGNVKRVMLEDIEPFFAPNPWTRALKGKKVLIIHPFADTIEEQYQKRNLLFEYELLPEFKLTTIKAVQTSAGEKSEFADWFEALNHMKRQIDASDFDVCIIGCGAYGFPLAAHVKRMGKKAVHLAGVTQLLFGIKGKRWENFIVYPYTNLFNEHWVRPGQAEKPKNAQVVEGACYW
jgi:hypothetical protein